MGETGDTGTATDKRLANTHQALSLLHSASSSTTGSTHEQQQDRLDKEGQVTVSYDSVSAVQGAPIISLCSLSLSLFLSLPPPWRRKKR